jgi:tRNA dimethylallyltransferase
MNLSGGSDVRDIPIICGPTAAGKSAIAMALAERTGALLISADSRQVYRRFDIGTSKPTSAERARVEHAGIDIIDPIERYSAAQWSESAMSWLRMADERGQPAIIVGGTGFYLHALESPLFVSPALDPAARALVLAELELESTEVLRVRCTNVDPARAHLGRTQLLRALETQMLTGRPLSEWLQECARPAAVRGHYLLIDPGDVLRDRIAARVAGMLAAGWEDEIRALANDVPPDAPAWNACGYRELRAARDGTVSREHAIQRTIIDTRQYAKRQRTWFRHQLPPDRVTSLDPLAADAVTRAATWLESATPSEHL